MKYSITSFEWKGGLRNLSVAAFRTDDENVDLKVDVEAKIIDNRRGVLDVNFHLNTEERKAYQDAWKFAVYLAESMFGGYSAQGMSYTFLVYPVNGEPLTVTMMKKIVKMLAHCGIHTISAPRVLTENFEGRTVGDKDGIPYGQALLKQVMKEEAAVLNNLGRDIDDLLAECRNHWDTAIAQRICKERSFPQLHKVNEVPGLKEFFFFFRHNSNFQEFLAFYLEALKVKVAGKANCGCVHHAEDGIACEHDLALLGPSPDADEVEIVDGAGKRYKLTID